LRHEPLTALSLLSVSAFGRSAAVMLCGKINTFCKEFHVARFR